MNKENIEKIAEHGFQLRNAAGIYWLIDMEQEGVPYRKPIPVNETGAKIWSLREMGKSQSEIAKELAECYGISVEEAAADVEAFFAMIMKHL